MKRAAIYLRVSTDVQTVENQRIALTAAATQKGWEVIGEYADHGISGTKGRNARPQFDALLKDAARGKFDVVAAWSVDRLGRSLQDLVSFLSELEALKVDLFLHQQALDTSTPSGRAMFGMLSIFGEFEAAMIRDRVNAGLDRARAAGKRLGRPPISGDKVQKIIAARATGLGMKRVAKKVGVGVGTVKRVLDEQRDQDAA